MEPKIHYSECYCKGCMDIREGKDYESCNCETYKKCYGKEDGTRIHKAAQAPHILGKWFIFDNVLSSSEDDELWEEWMDEDAILESEEKLVYNYIALEK